MKTFTALSTISLAIAGAFAALSVPASPPVGHMAGPFTSVDPPNAYYSLIREYEDGSGYVADYNMSIGDCYERMMGVESVSPKEWSWGCYAQPDGLLPDVEIMPNHTAANGG